MLDFVSMAALDGDVAPVLGYCKCCDGDLQPRFVARFYYWGYAQPVKQ